MSLSRAQLGMHWRLWARTKAVLMPGTEAWTKHEENERRHALYIEATGEDLSLTRMNNDQFDHVKAAMLAIVEPGNLNAQLQALNGQQKRLLYGIRKLASRNYIDAIVRTMNGEGKLGSSDLEELHPRELTKVMIALKKHEQRGGIAEPECLRAHTLNRRNVSAEGTALARNYEHREVETPF